MKKSLLFLLLVFVLVFAQACNLPGGQTTEEADPLEAALMTLTAAASPQAEETFTPLPSPTLGPDSNAPAATATPTFAYVTLSENTNCRTGPGQAYALVDTFLIGQTIEVIGKNPTNEYWYVRSPNNSSIFCWMWGAYATGGNLGNVPVFTPPPSPAPAPNFEASYAGLDTCVGWWVEINLKNTGTSAFRSISISVKDTAKDVTLSETRDGFTNINGCLTDNTTPSLDPGQSVVVSASAFIDNPTGNKVQATIKLCTETGLGGACVTKTIEFTP
jgi:hypothetical protein